MSLYQPTIEGSTAIKQYCSLFDSNPNPVLLLDSERVLAYCNSSFLNQFGENEEELLSYPEVKEIWEYYTNTIFTSDKEDLLLDDKTKIEFRKLVLNGEMYCMVALPSHTKLTLIASGEKGTQTKMASADQELISSVLENAPDAMLILNYDSQTYVAANKRAEALFGYTTDEFQSIKVGDLSAGVMDSGKNANKVADEHLAKCVKSGKRVVFEWQIRHKNGTLIPCEISVFKLPTQNGVYVRSSIMDISFKRGLGKSLDKNKKKDYELSIDAAMKGQREDQLQAFVRDSPIPVAMLDKNLNYLFVASEWVKKFPTKAGSKLVGRNHYELNPNMPMRWKLVHKRALTGQSVSMPRDKYIDHEGNEAWCRWDVKPWYQSEDTVGGIIIYKEDITEEVETENKSQEQERRFKHFFNSDSIGWIEVNAPDLFTTIRQEEDLDFAKVILAKPDLLGTVVRYNRKIADIFGLASTDDPTEFEPLKYVIEGREEFAEKCFGAVRDKIESFDGDIVIRNKYGEIRNLNVSLHFTLTGGNGEILYGIQDVTDLKESVKALRESEERYRTMFDSNSLGVIYTNYEQGMVKINESFTSIFGYTEEDMQHIDEKDMLLPSYQKLNQEISDDFRNGVKRYISVEKEYKRKDGRKIIAQTSSSALYDDAGVHYGNVTIIEDITERKTADLQIRKQNEELIKINKELDQFVYSAAHDLRAPIANVMGLVKLIRIEEISETAQHYLALQEKSLGKLDEFIKSIVDYSRNSRLDLAKDEMDLDEFVNEVVDQYRFSENAEKLKIDINVDQADKFITDTSRLSVVMNNLVSNAVRYMDVEKDDCFLDIQVTSDKTKATITVKDNGIGIEKEHLESIFKLFYRANSNSKGTGIGLYIVKETIDKLKGKIDVASKYKEGTTFTVTIKNFLPRTKKKANAK